MYRKSGLQKMKNDEKLICGRPTIPNIVYYVVQAERPC